MAELPEPGLPPADKRGGPRFSVRLENFTGPFDLLLGLISKHQLDITEVALAQVTDEFIGYIRELQRNGGDWELDEASEFLVLASTLLDLKAARLLPAGEVDSDEDIALLEARDLLFARLLQYRAFKAVAAILDTRLTDEAERIPRLVTLEPQFAALLPELLWKHTPQQFSRLAEAALAPKEAPARTVGLAHLHAPAVSVREQADVLARKLLSGTPLSFRTLIADAGTTLVVARFLALLEMFRAAVIAFEQASPLGELTIRWTASAGWTSDDLDEEYGSLVGVGVRTEGQ